MSHKYILVVYPTSWSCLSGPVPLNLSGVTFVTMPCVGALLTTYIGSLNYCEYN